MKAIMIVGSDNDRSIPAILSIDDPSVIHINNKNELTPDNINKWIKEGIKTVIIDPKDEISHNHPELIFPITMRDIETNVIEPIMPTYTSRDRKQYKDHCKYIQKRHEFKNNYKRR